MLGRMGSEPIRGYQLMLGCIEPIENRCFYNRACSGTSKPLDNVPSLGSTGVPGKARKRGLDRCVINLHPCLCEYPYWEHRAGFLDEGMIWDDNRVATRDLARSCAFERVKIRESVVPNDQAAWANSHRPAAFQREFEDFALVVVFFLRSQINDPLVGRGGARPVHGKLDRSDITRPRLGLRRSCCVGQSAANPTRPG